MNRNLILVFFSISLLTGCTEKHSTDPKEAYKYWAYAAPGKDVMPIRAQYWQSANWSKEYIVYLELAASVDWKTQFVKQNHLLPSQGTGLPADAPSWFKSNGRSRFWKRPGDDVSLYFEDETTGHFFIYEQQL